MSAALDDLVALGAGPGRVWGWVGRPDDPGVAELFAIRDTGATLLPLNRLYGASDAADALRDAQAAGVSRVDAGGMIVRERMRDGRRGAGDGMARSVSVPGGPAELTAGSVLIRTSGTSGTPRLVLLASEAIEASHRAVAERLDLRPDDIWWASLSPAHVGGLMLLLRARRLGSGIVATGGFDAATFAHLAGGGRISHASMVPTMLRRVLERFGGEGTAGSADGRSGRLRAILIGGAAADPDLLRRAVAAGLPVVTTWGMTEAASQVTTATPAETAADPTRSGRPLDGLSVEVTDSGELAIRGPTLAAGELVDGRIQPLPRDGAGRYQTGDLGEIDPDGHVRVTGRRDDRIISGGVNVDPVEVERTLRTLPGIRDAAVVGLPDPEWGERVVAAVVLEEGAALPEVPRELLAGARRPQELIVVDELPLSPNGKVDRGAVRGRVRSDS